MNNRQRGKDYERRTKKALESNGYIVESVERYDAKLRRSRDLFGCIDLVAYQPEWGKVVFVQVTGRNNMPARRKKLNELVPGLPGVLLVGWRKHKGKFEAKWEWLS